MGHCKGDTATTLDGGSFSSSLVLEDVCVKCRGKVSLKIVCHWDISLGLYLIRVCPFSRFRNVWSPCLNAPSRQQRHSDGLNSEPSS